MCLPMIIFFGRLRVEHDSHTNEEIAVSSFPTRAIFDRQDSLELDIDPRLLPGLPMGGLPGSFARVYSSSRKPIPLVGKLYREKAFLFSS